MLRHQSVHYLKRLEGLGNVVLLKEVCHWGWAFRQKSRSLPPPPPSLCLECLHGVKDVDLSYCYSNTHADKLPAVIIKD